MLFYLAREIKNMCMRKNKFIFICLFTDARVLRNKNNKKYVCINKNNINLLVYSLTLESGIKIPV